MARRINFGESESDARFAIEDDSDTGGDLRILDVSGASPVEIMRYDYSAGEWILAAPLQAVDLLDQAADPTDNGDIQLNGTDIKAYSGGSVKNLSDISPGVDVEDDGTVVVSDSTAINFVNDNVTDDGDGTVTVDQQELIDLIDQAGSPTANGEIQLNGSNIEAYSGGSARSLSNLPLSVAATGQVTLSSGSAVVDTGLSATDATFYLALGVDDPNADTKISGRLFWDDSAGTYKIEIVETDTSVGNPTANYDVVRVR